MLIKEIFELVVLPMKEHFSGIYLVMIVIAVLGFIASGVLLYKQNRYGKWLGLTSVLLLVNPVIYYLFELKG